MDLNEYQKKAMETCLPTADNIIYMGFNLSAEVGELLGKLAKAVRKDKLTFGQSDSEVPLSNERLLEYDDFDEEYREEIKKECGDVAWQLAGICHVLGFELEDVCQQNLDKLASRKQRGVIDGSGDNR